jgi:hypothetical protein
MQNAGKQPAADFTRQAEMYSVAADFIRQAEMCSGAQGNMFYNKKNREYP